MEFTIAKSALLAELVLLSDIISEGRKSVNPALSCVRITTEEDGIELVATDIDMTLRTTCPATIAKPGSAVIDAKRLSDVVGALNSAEVVFSTESNGWVKLNKHFKIATQLIESFPTIPVLPDAQPYEIEARVLNDLINRVGFAAAAKEDSRYALHGVQLVFTPGSIRMGALDGVIVAEATVQREGEDEMDMLILRKGLRALGRIAAEDGVISITAGPNQNFFQSGARLLAVGRLTGVFPPYRKVIPEDQSKVAAIDATQFTTLLRRANIASPYIQITLLSEGLMKLSAKSANGEDEEEMPIAYEGEPVSVFVRLERLEPFLKIVKGETIALALESQDQPLLFTFRTDVMEYRLLTSPWKPNVATEVAAAESA